MAEPAKRRRGKGKEAPRKQWAALRAAYRRGEGAVRDLAPKFGIGASTAEKRCAREKWRVQREETIAAGEETARRRDVESVADMLGKHRRLANTVLDLMAKELEVAVAAGRISADRLNDLSVILARTTPVERLAAGLERIKPANPMGLDVGEDEVVFEVDAPEPEEAAAPPAPVKT